MSKKQPVQPSLADKLQSLQNFAGLSNDDQVRAFRAKEAALSKLQKQLKDSEAKRKQAETELAEALDQVNLLSLTSRDVVIREYKETKKKTGGKATAIVGLMDWHSEEQVDPATINNFNKFDLSIAEKRIKRTFEKAVYMLEFARGVANIDELVVAPLGDLITGYIHEELEENNFLSPTEAILFVQEHLVAGLQFLEKHAGVKRIIVPTAIGNHGRTGQKKRISTRWKNSFEWMAYHQTAKYFSNNPKIEWKIEKGYHNWLEIKKRQVRFHHGDDMSYGGGIGGITVPVRKALSQWDRLRPSDLDVFGHFHQFIDDWRFVAGGCLIGYNAYALSIKADYQPPTQPFIVIDEKYGKTMAFPIFCDEPTV